MRTPQNVATQKDGHYSDPPLLKARLTTLNRFAQAGLRRLEPVLQATVLAANLAAVFFLT